MILTVYRTITAGEGDYRLTIEQESWESYCQGTDARADKTARGKNLEKLAQNSLLNGIGIKEGDKLITLGSPQIVVSSDLEKPGENLPVSREELRTFYFLMSRASISSSS